jgi:hypothetical protein
MVTARYLQAKKDRRAPQASPGGARGDQKHRGGEGAAAAGVPHRRGRWTGFETRTPFIRLAEWERGQFAGQLQLAEQMLTWDEVLERLRDGR